MKTQATTLLIFSLLAITACAPMDGRNGPDGGQPGRGQMEGGGGATVVDNLQTQLQKTAEALNLTPPQAVLWDAYQEKVGALMADQMKMPPYSASRQNALRQISQKVETVRNRLTAMEEIQEAASKLYGSLDEKQKAIADQTLPQTVPALYSGLGSGSGGKSGGERNSERPSGRGGPGGGGGMGGPGGGMGGGFGRM